MKCLWCGQWWAPDPNVEYNCFCCDECEDAYQARFENEDEKHILRRSNEELDY
jgi:hypothetical protein